MNTSNSFRERLLARPQLGIAMMYPAAGIIERIGPDWDWIWIDGQHGELAYADILAAVRACDFRARPSVVRVPGFDAGTIGRVLDMGATGVMVPMVESAEQARTVVEAGRFPPLGKRSFGGRRVIDLHGRGYTHEESLQPLVICQIESPAGLRQVKAIAAVDGVDALFFGADDMALQTGLRMDTPAPEGQFDEARRAVAAAARSHGKIAGGLFPTPAGVRMAAELGYHLIASTADVSLLVQGSGEKARMLRACIGETKG